MLQLMHGGNMIQDKRNEAVVTWAVDGKGKEWLYRLMVSCLKKKKREII